MATLGRIAQVPAIALFAGSRRFLKEQLKLILVPEDTGGIRSAHAMW
jgi:hypothetical protein